MTCRLILSLPVGSSVESLTPAQHATIGTVRGRWTAGGMPGTSPAAGRYLIDVLTDLRVTREMLDAIGLPLWLIVGCWSWDGAAPAVEAVEPFDAELYLPHMPETLLREVHGWAGWPPCIEAEP